MQKRLITAPNNEPITFDDLMKHQRRFDLGSDEETYYQDLIIPAVVNYFEENLSRRLITQEWQLILPCFPRNSEILIPFPPLQSISSIEYTDIDGENKELAADKYYIYGNIGSNSYSSREYGRIALFSGENFPNTKNIRNAVRVNFICGYGDEAEDIPPALRLAMLMLANHWSENRGVLGADFSSPLPIPMGVQSMLWQHSLGDA